MKNVKLLLLVMMIICIHTSLLGASHIINEKSSMNQNNNFEIATFASGCFWCTEAVFERLEGVIEVLSGFSGGKIKNPSYKDTHSTVPSQFFFGIRHGQTFLATLSYRRRYPRVHVQLV